MLWSSSPTANTPCRAVQAAGEHLQPRVLQPVGVLELVDQHVAEAALVVLAQRVVVAHQLVGAQHQLGEVDHAFALALLFVGLVDLHQLARLLVADLHVARALAVFLGAGDEPGHLLGHEALFVEVHRLDDALDGRELVAACRGSGSPAAGRRASSARAGSGCTGRGRCRSTCRARAPAASADRRVSISLAALLVKVTAITPPGETWPVCISQAMRVVSTRVLPEPAPARISAGCAGSVTAASCSR